MSPSVRGQRICRLLGIEFDKGELVERDVLRFIETIAERITTMKFDNEADRTTAVSALHTAADTYGKIAIEMKRDGQGRLSEQFLIQESEAKALAEKIEQAG